MLASDVKRVGVLGAGQMGRGIAQVAAASGIAVVLCDASRELAEKGKATIASGLGKLVDKGKMTAAERDAIIANVHAGDGHAAFADCDLVVEAATENVEIKLALFRDADRAMRRDAILASNTSSISITRLAAVTSRPDRVIGMHFMNPVPVMKLVEIVRGIATSEETFALVSNLAARMNKTVITSNDHPGFIVNRMLLPFVNEACFALQEGVGSAHDIDQGARLGLNHPLGPLELADLIGLDTCLAIAEVLHGEIGDPKYRPATILRNHVAAGWLGRKTGRGFYVYEGGQKK
jgi:3-hydroxybutyryl-CoA dehydrogenase